MSLDDSTNPTLRQLVESTMDEPIQVPIGVLCAAWAFLQSLALRLPCPTPAHGRQVRIPSSSGEAQYKLCACDRCMAGMHTAALHSTLRGDSMAARVISSIIREQMLGDTVPTGLLPRYVVADDEPLE